MPSLYKVIKNKAFVENDSRQITLRSTKQLESNDSDKRPEEWEKIIAEAEQKAQKVVDEAREKARKIEEEAEQNKEAVYQQSRKDGHEEGLQKAQEEADALKEQAQKVLEEAQKEREGVLKNSREELIEVAVKIGEAVVHRQVELDRETVEEIVSRAVEEAVGKFIKIKVAPEDLEAARKCRQQLEKEFPEDTSVTVMADKNVQVGGCIVETEKGVVDASLDTKLENIRQILRGVGIESED